MKVTPGRLRERRFIPHPSPNPSLLRRCFILSAERSGAEEIDVPPVTIVAQLLNPFFLKAERRKAIFLFLECSKILILLFCSIFLGDLFEKSSNWNSKIPSIKPAVHRYYIPSKKKKKKSSTRQEIESNSSKHTQHSRRQREGARFAR